MEEESQAEKRQLQAMHQQRVISMINQKKKVSMNCYTKALNDNAPNTHRVQKCLQKLLRALHKDRHHTIQHFRHLLETSLEQVRKMELYFLTISNSITTCSSTMYRKPKIWRSLVEIGANLHSHTLIQFQWARKWKKALF